MLYIFFNSRGVYNPVWPFICCFNTIATIACAKMKAFYNYILFVLPLFAALPLGAQTGRVLTEYVIINGDTVPAIGYDTYIVRGKMEFASKKKEAAFDKLAWRVNRAYPLAKEAGIMYGKIEAELKLLPENQRKERMKKLEEELYKKYEPEIKKMSLATGKILLKLIDRETGQNSYQMVKDLRGSFRAVFYQGLAKLFGANLKTEFDPENDTEDKMIDEIVGRIERGEK
jgi:Domain of unknown function (DUF4294)